MSGCGGRDSKLKMMSDTQVLGVVVEGVLEEV